MPKFTFDLTSFVKGQFQGLWSDKLTLDFVKTSFQSDWINQDIYLTTPELIAKAGYKPETHNVQTEDGYILTLHRIPHGKKAPPPPPGGRPVVLIQQGLLCSSAVWVMNSPDKSLAFRLADQGMDVWIGNFRGCTYSKDHISLTCKSKEYWNFSYHEMGLYDIPATFDYILNLTEQPDLHYIGHSQGTTTFFIGMTLRPEYNSKVRLMTALGPVAFLENILCPVYLMAPFVNQLVWLVCAMGTYDLVPQNSIMKFLGVTICHQLSPLQWLLPKFLHMLCGDDYEQLNNNLLPIMLGHIPAGVCYKSLAHFAQAMNSGEFRQYDHGFKQNQLTYGQPSPPDYDLSKCTAPVAIFYAGNDLISTPPDVFRLAEALPNLVSKCRVGFDKFNHMDFLWALDVDTLVYEKIEDLNKKFEGKVKYSV